MGKPYNPRVGGVRGGKEESEPEEYRFVEPTVAQEVFREGGVSSVMRKQISRMIRGSSSERPIFLEE